MALFPDLQKQLCVAQSDAVLLPAFQAALAFFAGVVSWYDIVSCSTMDLRPFKFEVPLLGNDTIHFGNVVGCEDCTVFAIRDIVELDYRKNNPTSIEQLSVYELVRRGNDIEARLMKTFEEVSAIDQLEAEAKSSWNISFARHSHNLKRSRVTRVYGSAALVYLHVVLSGADPNLPTIQENVTRTIEAFKALPDPVLVNSLAWPFCIAGCMAQEQDHAFFRDMTRFGEPADSIFGVGKAWSIVQECWRLRKVDPNCAPVDWKIAMKNLGQSILLV